MNDRQAQNALDRLWRTVVYHDLTSYTPRGLRALTYTESLSHEAARCLEPIKLSTWRIHMQRARKALLSVSEDPAC
jgi:hypothetical protein